MQHIDKNYFNHHYMSFESLRVLIFHNCLKFCMPNDSEEIAFFVNLCTIQTDITNIIKEGKDIKDNILTYLKNSVSNKRLFGYHISSYDYVPDHRFFLFFQHNITVRLSIEKNN